MTETSTELEPCPFCGAAPVRTTDSAVGPYWGHPFGSDCPSAGFYVSDNAPDRIEAIAAWNRRALRSAGEAPVTEEMIEAGAQMVDPSGIFRLTWQECKERAEAILRAALASVPAPVGDGVDLEMRKECATEGCNHPATVRFDRDGIGSEYCAACANAINDQLYGPGRAVPPHGSGP